MFRKQDLRGEIVEVRVVNLEKQSKKRVDLLIRKRLLLLPIPFRDK